MPIDRCKVVVVVKNLEQLQPRNNYNPSIAERLTKKGPPALQR